MLNEISQEKPVYTTDYIYMFQKKQITACLETAEEGGKKEDYKRI